MATLVLSAIFTLLLAGLVGTALKLTSSRPGRNGPGTDDRGPERRDRPEPPEP